MSGRICVNFVEKDINFILQVQNVRNFNQTCQFLYRTVIFVGTKIYGVEHI